MLYLTVALLALACAWPAAADEYLALRFPPARKPTVYLRLARDGAWVASSPEGLRAAPLYHADPAQTQQWCASY